VHTITVSSIMVSSASRFVRGAVLASGMLAAMLGPQWAVASETRGYVISWFHFAPNNTDADCPDGVNPRADQVYARIMTEWGKSPDEIKKVLASDDWVNKMSANAGQRGKIDGKIVDVYMNPTSVPDPHIKTGRGHVGLGFNLDGKDSPDNYIDPETGEHGVDNEFFRVVACTDAQQGSPKARPTHPSIVWDMARDQMPAWLIEVSGIDNIENDDDVEVTISRALEPVTRNAEGSPQSDMTFRVDPNPRSISHAHGRIKNGLLTTDSFDFNMIGDPYVMAEYHGKASKLRLKLTPGPDSGKGILGGYFPWKDLYSAWAIGGAVNEANLSLDIPGLYYALRRMADGYPDPITGQNTRISTSYVVETVPAFVKHVDEQSLIAASPIEPPVDKGPLANPPGVTIKTVKVIDGNLDLTARGADAQIVFADAKGMPLYASDSKRACDAECLKSYTPFLADQAAKRTGEWSVIKGPRGFRQWSLRGKPIFIYSKDDPSIPVKLASYSRATYAKGVGTDLAWHLMTVVPTQLDLPREISVAEVLDAPGVALVNSSGLTMYAFDKGKSSAPIGSEWHPVMAPAIAMRVRDFSIVKQPGDLLQWAYKGSPLFTFAGDREPNDANGKAADSRFQVAMVARYFTPSEVRVRENERRGGILVEAATGKTLYARDLTFHDHTGGHNARGFTRGAPVIGTMLNTLSCDADCQRDWKPLIASGDAQTSGYWSVFTRDDGTKQWAYQGYALYTFDHEKPGETFQHDSFTVMVNDDAQHRSPEQFGLGLYWRAVSP
jgi:predicted lipoprotein with Yx(FWY)xxD motif